jgi:hypothetical protein
VAGARGAQRSFRHFSVQVIFPAFIASFTAGVFFLA